MKYVVTGAAGNISKPLTEKLLENGHEVTVIGRNAEHLQAAKAKGARIAIGQVNDEAFLKQSFAGADAVYIMGPPNLAAPDLKDYYAQLGKTYAAAISANNISHVVNLSSVGAHMAEGCGPVSGLYREEQALNTLTDTNIRHLRPSYFYQNLLANIGLVKQLGIIGSNFSVADKKFPLADPSDIAEAAAEELLKLDFKGHSVRYIAGDEVSTDEIAAVLGKAIGKPDLKWVLFSDEQALNGMLQAGLPEELAKNYVEMGQAIHSGRMIEEYWKSRPVLGKVKLKDFAERFAVAYNAS